MTTHHEGQTICETTNGFDLEGAYSSKLSRIGYQEKKGSIMKLGMLALMWISVHESREK